MTATGTVVIVGAGQAGIQTAASLRQHGYTGAITVLGDEEQAPYERPPLSKAYLKSQVELSDITLRSSEFFAEQHIELRIDPAAAIHAADRRVELASGATLAYEHLVLAAGARARCLPVPGAHAENVVALHTAADATALRERLRHARSACVIGGGFIGLEFASVAAELGVSITVIERCSRTMSRVASPRLSDCLEALHRRHGVRLLLNTAVERLLLEDNLVCGVRCGEGDVDADLVVIGVGVSVDPVLARSAGLTLSDLPGGGIVVDDHLRTSDPLISAVGDCAVFPCAHAGDEFVRLESVQNACGQARAVAARLTGVPTPYRAVPWFWSDQFDTRVQIAGLTTDHDEAVVHGDPEGGRYSVYCFCERQLVGVESVNRPGDHIAARRMLARDGRPSLDDVSDPGFEPKACARRALTAA